MILSSWVQNILRRTLWYWNVSFKKYCSRRNESNEQTRPCNEEWINFRLNWVIGVHRSTYRGIDHLWLLNIRLAVKGFQYLSGGPIFLLILQQYLCLNWMWIFVMTYLEKWHMWKSLSYLCNFVEVVVVVFPIHVHVVDEEREVLHHCHHQILHVALDPGVTEGSEATLQSKCFVWSIAEGDKPHLTKLCLA